MRTAAIFFVLLLTVVARGDDSSPNDDGYDLAFLKQHQIKPDTAGLLAFFRNRTLTDEKIDHIGDLIKQLGHPRFQIRDQATKDLLSINVPALKYLNVVTRDADQEIANRASRLCEQIRAGPGSALPIAAARQLRKQSSDEVLPVLLEYLPFADDLAVAEAVHDALRKFGQLDGVADRRLTAAVSDPAASRRAAAGFMLGRSILKEQRDQARTLLHDADPWVRLRTAEGLTAGCDVAAVPALIALLDPVTDDITDRSEEVLRLIAGDKSPMPPSDDKPESRQGYVKNWQSWWEKSQNVIDLAKLPGEAPLLGLWVGIEYNTNCVWECGRDGKRRWTVQADGPMDAQVLPGNRVLIAEQTGKRVTERDLKGNVFWQFTTDEEPQNCQRLPNGNTFVATRNNVMEVRPDKSIAFNYKLSEVYVHGVRRMPNSHFVGVTSGGVIIDMNPAGKVVRTITMANEGTWGDVLALPGDRYLVTNYGSGFVREVDAAGKTLHEVKLFDACGLDRLPDGELLISGQGYAKIIDWTGRISWETTSEGCIRRIHRR